MLSRGVSTCTSFYLHVSYILVCIAIAVLVLKYADNCENQLCFIIGTVVSLSTTVRIDGIHDQDGNNDKIVKRTWKDSFQ